MEGAGGRWIGRTAGHRIGVASRAVGASRLPSLTKILPGTASVSAWGFADRTSHFFS